METLEVVEQKVEAGKPTSEEKVVEPTVPVVEPTVRTYKQEELDKAVAKSIASMQSQLSLSQAETRKLQAENTQHLTEIASREARIEVMQKEVDEVLTDDPERRKVYVDRIARLGKEQGIAKREAEVEGKALEVAKKEDDLHLALVAKRLIEETGIPLSELEGATTEEQMENRALKFQLKKPEEEVPTPKFGSLIPGGSGDSSDGLTSRELITRGLKTGK